MISQSNRTVENLEGLLLDHMSGVDFEDLPQEVVEYCKLLVVDSIGVAFPGVNAAGCSEVTKLAGAWGSTGATIFFNGHETSPPLAALANSTMMHARDLDDTLDVSGLHTFVNVLPAALATAEALGGVNGKELIVALVLGVDMICRLSYGIQRPLSWMRTSTCGSFGATVTAAKLLGLSRTQLSNALGVVYSQTSGNFQALLEGSLAKRMQPAFAAQAGVASAFMAQAGITGPHAFLEGPYGFYNLYERGEYIREPVVDKLGKHYSILDLSIKAYPACRMTHASIDAALELRKSVEETEKIDEIRIYASKMVTEMVGRPFVIGSTPQVDAQFSIAYTFSAALIRGDVFLQDFEVPAITDEKVKSLAHRVRVINDPDLPEKDILHARAVIKMKDGKTHEASIAVPIGSPSNPLGFNRCIEKFKKCVDYSNLDIDDAKVDKLLSMIEHLEQVDDVRQLIELIRI